MRAAAGTLLPRPPAGRRRALRGSRVELQVATELNPTDADAEAELREVRQRLRTKIAVSRGGKTELQTLIERTRDARARRDSSCPDDVKLPDSMTFSTEQPAGVHGAGEVGRTQRHVRSGLPRRALTADLRNTTLSRRAGLADRDARAPSTASPPRARSPSSPTRRPSAASTRNRSSRPSIVSNADLKEVIDLLRIVVDVRQISPTTAINAISLKDTPERIAAAGRLIAAIDKARPEVVIDVELLEVDRTRLREYGLQFASPGGDGGISGTLRRRTATA